MAIGLLIVALLAVGPFLWAVGAYHRLLGLRVGFRTAFGQIDALLKRRYELIPSLVEVARSHMQQERETLEAVIAARNSAASARQAAAINPAVSAAITQMTHAEGALTSALARMFALVEAYPALKADPGMSRLIDELTALDARVAFARQAFNDAVLDYNSAIGQFPASLVARLFKFRTAEPLAAVDAALAPKPPMVTFS